MYRDNSGADPTRNRDHPGAQELIWGLGDYPITPETHMRHVRRLGEECRREAEEALRTVKKNTDSARTIADSMRAYHLLTVYYEQKVLAATAAVIYGFGGDKACKAEAETLADDPVRHYEKAIGFIWEHIDKKSGRIKGRWEGATLNLPELIEREKRERKQLATLFRWPPEGN